MPTSLDGEQIILDLRTRNYEEFRTQLLSLIPRLTPEWTDVYPHDPGVVLIELFSAMADVNSYYIDKAVTESHWGTAQLRKSLVAMADLIGYEPAPAVSSTVTITVTADGVGGTIRGVNSTGFSPFQISNTQSDTFGSFTFELLEEYTLAPSEVVDLTFVEGRTVLQEVLGSSDGSRGQSYILLQYPVTSLPDGGSSVIIEVFNGVSWVLWSEAPTDNFIESSSTDKHFTVELDSEGRATIRFGDGTNGFIPEIGTNNIRATYRIGGGSASNSVSEGRIVNIKTGSSPVLSVTNALKPSGGDDAESVEEIRLNAPRRWATQNRAVTHEDYEALASSINGVFKVKAKWYEGSPTKEAVYVAVTGDNPVPTGTWDIAKQSGTGLLGAVGAALVEKACSAVVLYMLPIQPVSAKIDVQVHALENYYRNDVKSRVRTAVLEFIRDEETTEIPEFVPLSGLMHTIEKVDGVDFVNVNSFRRVPYVETVRVGLADTTFSAVAVGTATEEEVWTIFMNGDNTFTVEGTVSGVQSNGVIGSQYTSDGGEVSFLATAGAIANQYGDEYKILTGQEAGNIAIQEHEILIPLTGNPIIEIVGGIP